MISDAPTGAILPKFLQVTYELTFPVSNFIQIDAVSEQMCTNMCSRLIKIDYNRPHVCLPPPGWTQVGAAAWWMKICLSVPGSSWSVEHSYLLHLHLHAWLVSTYKVRTADITVWLSHTQGAMYWQLS